MDIILIEPLNHDPLWCCRACLSTDRRLFNIHENELADAFSRITGSPVSQDKLPQHLCVFCRTLLLKCASFKNMCLQTEQSLTSELLKGQLDADCITRINHSSHNILNLTITKVETINCIEPLPEEIKAEPNIDIIDIDSIIKQDLKVECENKVEEIDIDDNEIVFVKDVENVKKRKRKASLAKKKMKIEIEGDSDGIDDVSFDDTIESDIEDNYTVLNKLNSCVNKKSKKPKVKKEQKILKKKKESNTDKSESNYKKGAPYIRDAANDFMPVFDFAKFENACAVQVITLSKEEQLEEIASRKKSRNYLESRFRCSDCGKGYDAEAAYENHRARHSTKMGQHACEICSVRFKLKCRRQQHQDLHRLKFLCKECGFVSRTRSQAKRHHAMHAGKTFECQHCGKSFTKSSTYLTHVRRAHPALNVACDVCGETFVGEKGLKLHKKRTHSENMPQRFKCPACSVNFYSLEALSRHTDLAGELDHRDLQSCERCGESCASETALHAHVAETHPGELRRCEECSMTFASSSSFDIHHRRKHLNQRYRDKPRVARKRPAARPARGQFVCEQCGRILPNATLLRYHQRTHQDVKPYACTDCPKTFALKSSLNFHLRSHTGEKPFQCPLCPLAFSVKANLNRHHRTAHLKLHPRIPCSICGRVFTTNSCVRVHVSTVHHGQPGPKRDRRKRKNGKHQPESPCTVSSLTQ